MNQRAQFADISGDGVNRRLIVVVGQPRSGTTWLGKIFDSHPATLYRHEPDTAQRLSMPLLPHVEEAERYRAELERFVAGIAAMRSTKVCAKLPLFPKSYYTPARFALFRMSVLAVKAAERVISGIPVPSYADWRRVRDLAVVWKSIESIARVGVFARLLPSARFVVLVRHPCGFIASMLRGESQGNFVSRTPAAEDWEVFRMLLDTPQAHRRALDMAEIMKRHPMERMALRWLIPVEKAIEEVAGLENCRVVRYEDLCLDPAAVTRQLFDHARLPWAAQTEHFLTSSTAGDDGSYYSVVKNPVHSMNKWQQQLSTDDVARILAAIEHSKAGALYSQAAQPGPAQGAGPGVQAGIAAPSPHH